MTEANPKSLDELFAAEPDTLTDDDVQRMVVALREQRKDFKLKKQDKKIEKASVPMVESADALLDMLDLKL